MDHGDEIVRVLLMQMRGVEMENQADVIRELGKAGLEPARITELVGTSRGTVDVTLARAKNKERRGGAGGKKKASERGVDE